MATGSGTGKRAAAGASVPAGELVARLRTMLGDAAAATWSDDELLALLNEAVEEYSVHLPRRSEVRLTAVDGERRYGLPVDTAVVTGAVVGPDEASPVRLLRLSEANGRFRGGAVYDVAWSDDAATPPVLVLGRDWPAGTVLAVRLLRPHDANLSTATAVTVPAAHHHVLLAYGLFAAARRLQQQEQANPTSSSSLLMSQLASNVRRLELAYLHALNRILTGRLGSSERVVWGTR